jgi:hypothetical protein
MRQSSAAQASALNKPQAPRTDKRNHRRKHRSKINEKAAIATLKASMDSWSEQTDTFTAVANSSQNPKTLNAT